MKAYRNLLRRFLIKVNWWRNVRFGYNPKGYWKGELGYLGFWAEAALSAKADNLKLAQSVVVPLLIRLGGGETILDAGCGAGWKTYSFASIYRLAVGVDFQRHRLSFAKQHFSRPNVHYQEAELQGLPFANDSFDTIWTGTVLSHIPMEAKTKAVEEFKRVLSPSGFCLFSEVILDGEGMAFESRGHMIVVTLDWLRARFAPFRVEVLDPAVTGYPGPLLYVHS